MSENAHVELYKKYRPRTWSDVIGQEKQVRSIQGAVVKNRLPSAYLFSGPRGCGKTSVALILAKALNCPNVDKMGNPCNHCNSCNSIDNNRSLSVTYISSAQINGVESVRELVKQARLAVPGKKQVIILDEFHNLKGTKGFESLLIPLEEADLPALFIFCTTEVDKIPETILSRVQSRRFTLVPNDRLFEHVSKIAENEHLNLTDTQILDAVRAGRGSVRDTLTKLEEYASIGESNGDAGFGTIILEGVGERDLNKAWMAVRDADGEGIEPRALMEQLFSDLRDLVLICETRDNSALIDAYPLDDPITYAKRLYGARGIVKALDVVGEGLTNTAFGADSRIQLEVAILRMIKLFENADKKVNQRRNAQ